MSVADSHGTKPKPLAKLVDFVRTGAAVPALVTALAAFCLAMAAWFVNLWGAFVFAMAAFAAVFFTLASCSFRRSRLFEEKCAVDEALLQSQKLAALGELSSGIAHEINTPLAVIGQEVELIEAHLAHLEPGQAKGVAESAAVIKEMVVRCRDITHQMLSFARKRTTVPQRIDVNELVEDMARLVEREAKLSNIEIQRLFDPKLPLVETDAPLLRQVVLNLMNNAVQAVERDGVVAAITRREGEHIVVGVRDSGKGIPPEVKARMFNPFFTTKPPGQGTGLGLSISLSIVDKLGGTIEVESEPGRGALFEVVLPVLSPTRR